MLRVTTLRIDDERDSTTHRLDVLWYYLSNINVVGNDRTQFKNLLARILLSTVHSEAANGSSAFKKNLNPQRTDIDMKGTLSSSPFVHVKLGNHFSEESELFSVS